jgi:hypothetical protein
MGLKGIVEKSGLSGFFNSHARLFHFDSFSEIYFSAIPDDEANNRLLALRHQQLLAQLHFIGLQVV